MKNISKGTEPKSLTQHRCNTNSDYDNYPDKDDLRESLVGTSINCLTANPKSLKLLESRAHSQ